MQKKITSILVVGAEAGTLPLETLRASIPSLEVASLSRWDEVAPEAEEKDQVVVFVSPPPGEAARAAAVVDEEELRRWPVVSVEEGEGTEGVITLTLDEWRAGGAVQALRFAVEQKSLLRQAARARGDAATMARRISHDLSSPLSCILTMACVLQEASPENAELTEPIVSSADEINRIIDRINQVGKASAWPVHRESLSMGGSFKAALNRLKEDKLVPVPASVLQPKEWPVVEGVPSWLETIWWNLLVNAMRHAGAGAEVEAGWDRNGEGLRFWLRDTGPGLPAGKMEKGLPSFHRLHETGAPRGLGLSIVRRLVELQDGRFGFENLSPHGSLFFFILPAAGDSSLPSGSRTPAKKLVL
jgi:signal transduction histidine kinase